MNKPVNKAYKALQEEWGINTDDLTTENHTTLGLQQAFLLAYSQCGTIAKAAEIIGIHRYTAFRWRQQDTFRFKDRMLDAQATYCDVLENKAHELAMNLDSNNNPVMLITLLNANLPDKYRPNSVLPSEAMTDTLRAMKQASREHRRLADGSEVTTETVTEVTIKPGLSQPRTEE